MRDLFDPPTMGTPVESVNNVSIPPLRYFYEDVANFARINEAVATLQSSGGRFEIELASKDVLADNLETLRNSKLRGNDTLMLYIAAHGVVVKDGGSDADDGAAYLMCSDFDAASDKPADERRGLFPLETLLRSLANLPGDTKLLLLDTGQHDLRDRQLGTSADFDAKLLDVIEKVNSPSLYVITANGPGEYSHVMPSSEQTVFAHVLARGVTGAANPQGSDVSVAQLFAYTKLKVANWVNNSTENWQTQTPQMRCTTEARELASSRHVLFTDQLSEDAKRYAADAEDGKQSGGALLACQNFFNQRLAGFGFHELAKDYATRMKILPDSTSRQVGDEPEELEIDEQEFNEHAADRERLLRECWELTTLVETQAHPYEFAPHAWRSHLDRLIWLEQMQSAGNTPFEPEVKDGLVVIKGALQNLAKRLGVQLPRNLDLQSETADVSEATLREVVNQRPALPFTWDECPTLALAERDDLMKPLMPQTVKRVVRRFDQWLAGDNLSDAQLNNLRQEYLAELKELLPLDDRRAFERFYEVQLVAELGTAAGIPADLVRLALRTRRTGEQVAADDLAGRGWANASIDRADSSRLRAERHLLDRAAIDWRQQARAALEQARYEYRLAREEIDDVRRTIRLARRMSLHMRDYEIIFISGWEDSKENNGSTSESPRPNRQRPASNANAANDDDNNAAMEQELSDLRELLVAVETADPRASDDRRASVSNMRDWYGELDGILEGITGNLADAEWKSGKIQVAKKREPHRLLGVALSWDSRLDRRELLTPRPDEIDLNKLTEDSSPPPISSTATLHHVFALPAIGGGDLQLDDWATRNARLTDLRAHALSLNWCGADRLPMTLPSGPSHEAVDGLLSALVESQCFDLVHSLRSRFENALQDSTRDEADRLVEHMRRCDSLIEDQETAQPEPGFPSASPLRLDVRDLASKTVTSEGVPFDIQVDGLTSGTDYWIVAQYDPNQIEVKSNSSNRLYNERELRDEQGTANWARGYPLRPDVAANVTPTATSTSNGARLTFTVEKSSKSSAATANLVLRVIGGGWCARARYEIQLPNSKLLQLSVRQDGQELTSRDAEHFRYGLFPNRPQDIALVVTNSGDESRSLEVNLYEPRAGLTEADVHIPRGVVAPDYAERLRDDVLGNSFGSSAPIATGAREPNLRPGREWTVEFDFQESPNSNVPGDKPTDPEFELPEKSLIVEVKATKAGSDSAEATYLYRWMHFEAWRPNTYLDAKAFYDPNQGETLEIELRTSQSIGAAGSPAFPPGEPISARLIIDDEFVDSFGDSVVKKSIDLNTPNPDGTLWVPLKPGWHEAQSLVAAVEIDNYPRAFRFDVKRTQRRRELFPPANPVHLRIVSPAQGTQMQPQSGFIEARFEVDAPDAVLENNPVRFGVDDDPKDNELDAGERRRGESRNRDRHFRVLLQRPRLGSNATLSILPMIDDWTLRLPTDTTNAEVNVIAELDLEEGARKEAKRHTVTIDGEGPIIMRRPSVATTGDSVEIRVEVEDKLSGIELVEAAFAPELGKEPDWVRGNIGSDNRYLIQLDAASLESGSRHTILFRAKDKLGNFSNPQGQFARVNNVLIEKMVGTSKNGGDSTTRPVNVRKRIGGRVTYADGTTPINVSVELEGKNLEGENVPPQELKLRGTTFTFEPVPAGTYTITATGVVKNRQRTATEKVTVSNQPGQTVNIEVSLGGRRR